MALLIALTLLPSLVALAMLVFGLVWWLTFDKENDPCSE